jgi:hypothetical protein
MVSLDEELSGSEKFSEPPPLAEPTNTLGNRLMYLLSKLNWKTAAVAGAILAVILIACGISFLVHHHKNKEPLTDLPPAVYQSDSGETLPLPK